MMLHTIRKLFRYNFQKKLFFSYTVLIIVVICLAVSLFLRYLFIANSFIIEENQKTLTQKTAQQIDGFLGSMDAMALQIMSDPRLVQVFSDLYSHPVEGNYFKQELAMERELGRILMALNGPRLSMGRISLYNAQGDYVSAGYLYETSQVVEDTLTTLDIAGLEARMDVRRIRREIRGPHPDDWSDSGQDILSVYRPLKELYSGRTFAVIEVQQSLEMFEKMLAFQDRADIQAYVFDDAGGLVYPKNAGDAALAYLDTTVDTASSGEVSITEHGNEFVSFQVLPDSGWRLAIVQSNRAVLLSARPLLILSLLLGFFVLLLSLFVVFAISRRLTRPLVQIRHALRDVSLDNLSLKLEPGDDDELTQLSHAFSSTFDRLRHSIDNEMRAHILAAQSQMNPHFLYNTLTVIGAAGYEGKSDKVYALCEALSDMLRYVSSYDQWEVSVAEESAHTRNYLELMKERYEDGFCYHIEVESGAEAVVIPKLAIQPLAENSFKHGFDAACRPWTLSITVKGNEEAWSIKVEDNGRGFTPEEVERLRAQVRQYAQDVEAYKTAKDGGIGLVNTLVRLELLYHGKITWDIGSLEPRGAVVIIRRQATLPGGEETAT